MALTTQIWQHNPSGELYLVAVDLDGKIIEACGPVTQNEAEYTHNEGDGFFNNNPEDVEWITENRESFRVKFGGNE